MTATGTETRPQDAAALDAYSRTVIDVTERLAPSVASIRVQRAQA